MTKLHVVNLKNGKNAGDDNNALAITKEVLRLEAGALNTTVDVEEIDSFIKSAAEDTSSTYVFIGAGNQSLEPLSKAKKAIASCKTIWSSHQVYKEILDHEENLDKIALPITEQIELKDASKRISTLGVPSILNAADTVKEYEAKKDRIISSDTGYITIVMGGDANNAVTGKWQYYTVAEAEALADYAAFLHKKSGKKLLITNGPRTGKFNPETGEETLNHRDFDPKTKEAVYAMTDPCSDALIEKLVEKGLSIGEDFQFSDFRFLEKGVDSAYKSFLGAVVKNKSNSFVLMAGESTSMLTDCLNVDVNLAAYTNKAMNDSHNSFFKMLTNNGFMYGLDDKFQIISKTDEFKSDIKEYVAAETQIANIIQNIANPAKPVKKLKLGM